MKIILNSSILDINIGGWCMLGIAGYKIIECINKGNKNIIYKAIREEDNIAVMLKMPISNHPDISIIEMLKNEYQISTEIHSSKVVKIHGIQQNNNRPLVIMEDFAGVSLQSILNKRKLTISEFLDLAIEITEAINDIHKFKIVHNDVNPSNVNEINKPTYIRNGHFISGKFDQFQCDIPYYALRQAIIGLIDHLLTERKEKIEMWKNKLVDVLDGNVQLVVDYIPKIEKIIGKQSNFIELPIEEIINRIKIVFHNFIKVLCDKEHPLVIFLDDMQWADLSTFRLIEELMDDSDIKYFLLIISYRDNEVDKTPPLCLY
jgi:hypothetical protein